MRWRYLAWFDVNRARLWQGVCVALVVVAALVVATIVVAAL